jgi:hypothetical protein
MWRAHLHVARSSQPDEPAALSNRQPARSRAASTRVLRNSSGIGTGTGRAQGAPHLESQHRSETRRQVLQKRPASAGALHGSPIQAGCGQARNTTPAANHAPILPIAAHRSTSRRSRPRPALLIALECMMRCGPPHQTSRRSQHASCLACTTVPSDVCGERALASLHGSH